MADIEKILDNLNIPKQIIDKSEELLKALFGPSFDEMSGIIADQVRLRRFRNQIKIFTKAQAILKETKIDPQKVSLKVLAPLIELSSYEEVESLQDKWSKLIAHILNGNQDLIFQQNCISILSKLSSDEAVLLEELFDELQKRRIERHEKQLTYYEQTKKNNPNSKWNTYPKQPDEYPVTSFEFNILQYAKSKNMNQNDLYFKISNLITLGLLKWETNVQVEATKSVENPKDSDIDVEVYVDNDEAFVFTSIGDKFIKLSKGL